MFQAYRILLTVREEVGILGKQSRDLSLHARNALLVDGDPDQNGGHALRGRVNPMPHVSLIHLVPPISFLSWEILFDGQSAALDNQNAVNVLVGAVPDLSEQVLDPFGF